MRIRLGIAVSALVAGSVFVYKRTDPFRTMDLTTREDAKDTRYWPYDSWLEQEFYLHVRNPISRTIQKWGPEALWYKLVYARQRLTQNYDNTFLWSLDYSLAKMLADVFHDFGKNIHGCPEYLITDSEDVDAGVESWAEIIKKIETGFRNYYLWHDHNWEVSVRDREEDELNGTALSGVKAEERWTECYAGVQESLRLMSEWYPSLWD